MTRVYIADAKPEELAALRILILDLNMEVVGEATDWATTLAQAPVSRTDMLLIEWDLLPNSPIAALDELRKACPAALVIVLICTPLKTGTINDAITIPTMLVTLLDSMVLRWIFKAVRR